MTALTKDQLNQVYLAIADTKLNPKGCDPSHFSSDTTEISHTASRSVFTIRRSPLLLRFSVTFTVANELTTRRYRQPLFSMNFDSLLRQVQGWANAVADWMAIPD